MLVLLKKLYVSYLKPLSNQTRNSVAERENFPLIPANLLLFVTHQSQLILDLWILGYAWWKTRHAVSYKITAKNLKIRYIFTNSDGKI